METRRDLLLEGRGAKGGLTPAAHAAKVKLA
jgi:hypothetical protein